MTSNTHAGIFTRIPHRINKKWERKIITLTGDSLDLPSSRHVLSPIESVDLNIVFSTRAAADQEKFDETDDISNDRMSFVQQQKQLFSDLESAVQKIVSEYSSELVRLAESKGFSTVEIPSKRTTAYYMAPSSASTYGDRSTVSDYREPDFDYSSRNSRTAGSRVETIAPSDAIDFNDVQTITGRMSGRTATAENFARVIRDQVIADMRKTERQNERKSRKRSASKPRTIVSIASKGFTRSSTA